jgi:hypothetical protein
MKSSRWEPWSPAAEAAWPRCRPEVRAVRAPVLQRLLSRQAEWIDNPFARSCRLTAPLAAPEPALAAASMPIPATASEQRKHGHPGVDPQ